MAAPAATGSRRSPFLYPLVGFVLASGLACFVLTLVMQVPESTGPASARSATCSPLMLFVGELRAIPVPARRRHHRPAHRVLDLRDRAGADRPARPGAARAGRRRRGQRPHQRRAAPGDALQHRPVPADPLGHPDRLLPGHRPRPLQPQHLASTPRTSRPRCSPAPSTSASTTGWSPPSSPWTAASRSCGCSARTSASSSPPRASCSGWPRSPPTSAPSRSSCCRCWCCRSSACTATPGCRCAASTRRCTTRSPTCPTASCCAGAPRRRSPSPTPTHPVAVMLIDLDHFKEINDTMGHHVGDMVIREVAKRLTDDRRRARHGGPARRRRVRRPAHRHRGRGRARARWPPTSPPGCASRWSSTACGSGVQASVGIAIAPQDADSFETLLKRADIALYRAKSNRGEIQSYRPGDRRLHDRAPLAARRPAQRGRQRRVRARLPAAGVRPHRRRPLRRGAQPLAAPAARPGAARTCSSRSPRTAD